MSMTAGGGSPKIKIPSPSQEYQKGLNIYLKNLPTELQQELGYRQQYDPQFIQQQLGLQQKYDPALAQQQMAALQRRDPEWMAMHQGLGDKISAALQRGYLDPRQEAAYQQYGQLAGKVDPTRGALYKTLGAQYQGDVLRGGTADPATLRQMTQAILSRSPTMSYGEAQNMATAVYTGQRSEALKQQRQQGAGQFLQQMTPEQQQQQGLAQFYSMAPPEAQTLAQAGSYLSSPTVNQMMNQIPGVQAPRSFGYVNPNAGYQGQQYGLQNFQNQLAANQLGSGGSNPWMNALGGAGTGAQIGSMFGGAGYGTAIGAGVGALAGAFGYPQYSDERLKNNISRTGASTKDGIPIVEYDYDGKRWRGVLAQDVLKVRPDAVTTLSGGRLGVFYSKLGIQQEEV